MTWPAAVDCLPGASCLGRAGLNAPFDYFEVKTSQFKSVSMQVLPALRSAGLAFSSVGDHSTFAGLRAQVLALAERHGN